MDGFFWWGFPSGLAVLLWAAGIFGCWWLARNSGHSTGYAVFWGVVGGVIALAFYAIFYYRDRDNVPPSERVPLGLFGGGYGRREKACLNCGTIVPERANFCPSCGGSIPKPPVTPQA